MMWQHLNSRNHEVWSHQQMILGTEIEINSGIDLIYNIVNLNDCDAIKSFLINHICHSDQRQNSFFPYFMRYHDNHLSTNSGCFSACSNCSHLRLSPHLDSI